MSLVNLFDLIGKVAIITGGADGIQVRWLIVTSAPCSFTSMQRFLPAKSAITVANAKITKSNLAIPSILISASSIKPTISGPMAASV